MQDWYEEKVCEVLNRGGGNSRWQSKDHYHATWLLQWRGGRYSTIYTNQKRTIQQCSFRTNRRIMNEPQVLTPKRTEEGKRMRKDYEAHKVSAQRKEMQQLEPREDGISNTLTTAQKDNYLMVPSNTAEGYVQCEIGGVLDISYPSSTTRRGRVQEGGQSHQHLLADAKLRMLG